MKYLIGIVAVIGLVGCSTPEKTLQPSATNVVVEYYPIHINTDCQWLGDVTGSEGHWYSYLFYPNDVLVRGSLNEIKNNTHAIGADSVLIHDHRHFQTSSTLSGSAYKCLK